MIDTTKPPVTPDELTLLKETADELRIKYHPNIGLEALREKIEAYHNEPKADEPADIGATPEELIAGYQESQRANLSPSQLRNEAYKECNRLVRVVVNCMNPTKRDWPGEMIEVSNSLVGTFKKFIPFNNAAGYHIPHIIFQALKERKCQIFVNGTDSNGNPTKRAKLISEFAVEVLDPLTEAELKELAQRQLMASGAQE